MEKVVTTSLPTDAQLGALERTWIVDNDQRISITRRYQIVRESDGVTLLRGRTKWVCVALDSGKPRRMPPEFLTGYRPTAQESV